MSCRTPKDVNLIRASGVAKVGLCPKFREKWDSMKTEEEKNKFLNEMRIKKDYVDDHGMLIFKINSRVDFIDMNSKINDPVIRDEIKDMATLFVNIEYNTCHPHFSGFADPEDKDEAIKSVLYEWIIDDLKYICSLRQIKPYQLGLVVSKKRKNIVKK